MVSKRKYFICLLTGILLGGCAADKIDYDTLRNSSKVQIKRFETLLAKPIKADEKECVIRLGEKPWEVLQFGKERVFAAKFLLEPINQPFSIRVVSEGRDGFFVPKTFFLDANNQIIKATGVNDFHFDRGMLKGTVFVNQSYNKIRSIIVTQVLNDKKKIYHTNRIQTAVVPIYAGSYMFNLQTASGDQNVTLHPTYAADVKLTIHSYHP